MPVRTTTIWSASTVAGWKNFSTKKSNRASKKLPSSAASTLPSTRWRSTATASSRPARTATEGGSERLQVLGQVGNFGAGEAQRLPRVVAPDDVLERGRAAVVEIRRVLPQAAQGRAAILLGRG